MQSETLDEMDVVHAELRAAVENGDIPIDPPPPLHYVAGENPPSVFTDEEAAPTVTPGGKITATTAERLNRFFDAIDKGLKGTGPQPLYAMVNDHDTPESKKARKRIVDTHRIILRSDNTSALDIWNRVLAGFIKIAGLDYDHELSVWSENIDDAFAKASAKVAKIASTEGQE